MNALEIARKRQEERAALDPVLAEAIAAKRARLDVKAGEFYAAIESLGGAPVRVGTEKAVLDVTRTAEKASVYATRLDQVQVHGETRYKKSQDTVASWHGWYSGSEWHVVVRSAPAARFSQLEDAVRYLAEDVGNLMEA